MKKCPNCGFSNSKDAKFCVKCGHHFATANVCPNCGRKLKNGTKFCPYCGTKQSVAMPNRSAVKSTSDQNINSNNVENTAQNKVNSLLNMKQDTKKEEAENSRKEESLNLQERTYIENKVDNEAPSTGVTYLLGIFLFEFGAPQWYLHHYVGGVMALICTFVLSWIFGLGFIIEFIWGIIDLFLYPLFIRHARAKIKRQAINEVIMMRR